MPGQFVFRHLIVALCSVIFFLSAGLAQDSYKTGDYYENARLSELLNQEGFKFGLSKEESAAFYQLRDLDPLNPQVLCNKHLMSTYGRGFYVAIIEESKNVLLEVAKCIDFEIGLINERGRIEAFKTAYGLKDSNGMILTMGGIDSDTLPLIHDGRKIQVTMRPLHIEEQNKTAIILCVVDQTNPVINCD